MMQSLAKRPSTLLTRGPQARTLIWQSTSAYQRQIAAYSGKDKSWGEIAQDAAELAGSVVSKVADSVKAGVTGLVKRDGDKAGVQRRPNPLQRTNGQQGPLWPGAASGGLLGMAMGKLITTAMEGLASSLAEASQAQQDVQQRAADVIRSSRRLRSRLGAVTVGSVLSSSSSTSSINGRTERRVVLGMPLTGARGDTAAAQVQYVEGPGGAAHATMRITVQLADGQVLHLDPGSEDSSASHRTDYEGGRVIDAEFRDLR